MPKPEMGRIELRVAQGALVQPAEGATGPNFKGYAAVFNSRTNVGGWFEEIIAPGAFAESLASGDDVVALFNHEDDYVLGRRSANTLRLAEDAKGLYVEIDGPDTQLARDLAVSVARRDITQMSFGFRCLSEKWDEPASEGGTALRTLLKVQLIDVSIVTFPQYEDTEAEACSVFERSPMAITRRAAALAETETMRRRIAIAEASSRSRNPAA